MYLFAVPKSVQISSPPLPPPFRVCAFLFLMMCCSAPQELLDKSGLVRNIPLCWDCVSVFLIAYLALLYFSHLASMEFSFLQLLRDVVMTAQIKRSVFCWSQLSCRLCERIYCRQIVIMQGLNILHTLSQPEPSWWGRVVYRPGHVSKPRVADALWCFHR